MTTASICVFCGASQGQDPSHMETAQSLGKELALANYKLVYGAGDLGLMGAVARSAQGAGGRVLGVIPEHLLKAEAGKSDLETCLVTENMHERKKLMYMNSDASVLLPGGIGSLDEFVEILTWAQLGLHDKPIFILNTNGYWDPLLGLLDHIIAQGFAHSDISALFRSYGDVAELMQALRAKFS